MEVFKDYRFEAAHRLAHLPATHPCHRLHGHSYRVRVGVAGEVSDATGFVVDFADIDAVIAPLVARLDHRDLNEVEGLRWTTAEDLASWFWQRARPALPGLARIELWETESSGCVYRGDG